jgi:hypothetical protein
MYTQHLLAHANQMRNRSGRVYWPLINYARGTHKGQSTAVAALLQQCKHGSRMDAQMWENDWRIGRSSQSDAAMRASHSIH